MSFNSATQLVTKRKFNVKCATEFEVLVAFEGRV